MSKLNFDRRHFLARLCGGAAGLSIARLGFSQAAPTPIRATKLTDRVALLSGDGGNVGLVIAEGGLLMIDGGFANRALELQKAVADTDSHPVKILFNTHWHGDHVGSNELLGKAGVKIMAHQNAKVWLSQKVTIEAFNTAVEPLKPEGLPAETFTDSGKMTFGKEKVEYKWFPNAHTDNDAWVFLPAANVLQTGDLFFSGTYPVIDYTTGGWIGGMASALDKLLKVGDAQTKIIPGHGPLSSKDDMRASRDMLHQVFDRLSTFSKKDASLDDVLKANPVQGLESKWGQGFLNGERFLRMAYPSIAKHAQLQKSGATRRVSW
ncbi:MAG: MBL fold metallo-hydrolase [Bryobacteraceae bacterium]|jgi:glyoxylase-like metal-dependent hydrolase (beta-lactamase superfamily II)